MQASAKPQLEAFADVERIHSRGDWSEALDAGQALLAALEGLDIAAILAAVGPRVTYDR
jgi:hypothetical protein